MITGELKSKIDGLWEIFWTGGLTNPLDVVEQMTYLMFIRDLDDVDNLRSKESAMLGIPYQSIFAKEVKIGERKIAGSQMKWSVFHDFPAPQLYSVLQEWVFPFIKGLHGDKESAYAKYMGDAIFKVPTPLMLEKIVTAMPLVKPVVMGCGMNLMTLPIFSSPIITIIAPPIMVAMIKPSRPYLVTMP